MHNEFRSATSDAAGQARTTRRAQRSAAPELRELDGVATRQELALRGFGPSRIAAQIAANTWHRVGPAIVLHNSAPTLVQRHRICLLNCGPHALLTSFTALEVIGLRGGSRAEVHIVAPAGVARPAIPGLRLHRVGRWSRVLVEAPQIHDRGQALVIAASSFTQVRAALGIIAMAVQQHLLTVEQAVQALTAAPRTRHRAALLRGVADLAQGPQAFAGVDIAALCRRYELPAPTREQVRVARGRRRFLDAQWRSPAGDVLVEVDAAPRLTVAQWCAERWLPTDGTDPVLRIPAVVVREEPEQAAERLRRMLSAHR